VIQRRKSGELTGLRTYWKKFNRLTGGGIQEGGQYVIGGRSGVGKSAFVNLLIKSLFDCNPHKKVVVLYFNFEMPSYKQVVRNMSNILGLTVDQLMSAEDKLTDDQLKNVIGTEKALSDYNIYFIDVPLNITQIYQKIIEFRNKFPNYDLVNVFDHSRLVIDEEKSDEMRKIDRLSKTCMYLKKKIHCSNIIVSQLNRNIESPDRAKTDYEPIASDIFGADSVYQDADMVIVLHSPEKHHVKVYHGLPTKDLIAMHILKNRDGDTGMIPFKHNLKINTVVED
jgi:replicative DNA helicase